MYEVIGINFANSKRIYYFSPDNLELKENIKVIVETERGMQIGVTCTQILTMPKNKILLPLKKILRIANEDDIKKQEKNEKLSFEAMENAKKIAQNLNLDMKFINCSFTLDRNQLIYNFIADDRVDFRELAKKLASIYRTRIELRQVGVRDKAKEIGGIGPCGRFLCCNTFLTDFNSVSINMAKNQYLSLNPTKINGICGRLLCCLKYEDEQYTEMKKKFPAVGSRIKNKDVEGKVISHNLFTNTYLVEKSDKTLIEVENR